MNNLVAFLLDVTDAAYLSRSLQLFLAIKYLFYQYHDRLFSFLIPGQNIGDPDGRDRFNGDSLCLPHAFRLRRGAYDSSPPLRLIAEHIAEYD